MGRKSIANTTIQEEDPVSLLDTIRNRTLRLLKSAIGQIGKLDETAELTTLRVLKEELEYKWSDYMRAFEQHEAALSSLVSPELTTVSQEFIETHNKYVQTKVALARLMDPLMRAEQVIATASASPRTPGISSNFKMPPIRITPFDGNLCDWKEFKATCDSVLVDTIPDVQRLQYLKDALSGEPRNLVSHILPDKDAYKQAMVLLQERYQNNRAIINEHLRRFFAIPSMGISSAASLRDMLNTINHLLAALKSCNINTDSWNSIIIFCLTQRFDKSTLEQWEERLEGKREIPELKTLLDFLQVRITVCETTEQSPHEKMIDKTVKLNPNFQNTGKPQVDQRKPIEKPRVFYTIKPDYKCLFCGSNHLHTRCDALPSQPLKTTMAIVKRNNLCENCLYPHPVQACPFQPACKKCSQPHNTLLHPSDKQVFLNQTEHTEVEVKPEASSNETNHADNDDRLSLISDAFFYHVDGGEAESEPESALLSTAIVAAKFNGRSALMKALVDGGSTGNLITVNACQLLMINYPRFKIRMTSVGGVSVGNVVGRASLEIGSIYNNEYSVMLHAIVVRRIGDMRGFDKHERAGWKHLHGLPFADPSCDEPGEFDMLLGTVAYADILLPGLRKGARDQPIGLYSELGWLVFGRMGVSRDATTTCHRVNVPSVDELHDIDLSQQLRSFWEIEEVACKRKLTEDEQFAETTFQQSVRRADDGKFIVDLPFQCNPESQLGYSRDLAERRYKALQRRLDKNPSLKQSYDEVLKSI